MKNPLMWNEEWNGKWDDITKNILDKHPDIKRGSDEYGTLLAMELREMGYDGVLDMKEDVVNEAVVFDDNQVLLNNVEKYNLNNTLFQQAPPIDSEAFKAWFGDSKVVDENGQPLVVYHGGSFDVTNDPIFSSREGFYFFTKDPKIAQSYNRYGSSFPLTEVYLSLQNPFIPSNPKHVNAKWVKDWIRFWEKEDGWVDRFTGEEMETYDVLQMIEETRLYDYDSIGSGERWHDFLQTAKKHHDGFYGYDPTDGGVISVAFSPTQIKSVNNQGTWDAENPNILFQNAVDDRYFKAT